jgi:hypothetical protein
MLVFVLAFVAAKVPEDTVAGERSDMTTKIQFFSRECKFLLLN